MNKDIEQYNAKGEEHGFAEYYWDEKVIRKNYHL